MTVTYYPFDSGAGATVNQAQWEKFAKYWFTDGVVKNGTGTDLAITNPGGMFVQVGIGRGFIQGTFGDNDANLSLAVSAADPSLPRIDLVVMRCDTTAKTIAFAVKAGTPAGSPVAPVVTYASPTFELALATVLVPAAASTPSTITDVRTYGGGVLPSAIDAATLQGTAASGFAKVAPTGVKVYVQQATPGSPNKYDIWIQTPFA
jgi:hypothetical protein